MHVIFDFETDRGFLVGADSPVGYTTGFLDSSASTQEQKTFLLATRSTHPFRGLLTMHCLGLASSLPRLLCGQGKASSILNVSYLTINIH